MMMMNVRHYKLVSFNGTVGLVRICAEAVTVIQFNLITCCCPSCSSEINPAATVAFVGYSLVVVFNTSWKRFN